MNEAEMVDVALGILIEVTPAPVSSDFCDWSLFMGRN